MFKMIARSSVKLIAVLPTAVLAFLALTQVADAAQFVYPIAGRITDTYYAKRYYGTHGGLDLAGGWREPIFPARPGKVSFAGWGNGYGWHVIIDHDAGYQTYYGHMALRPLVKKSQDVTLDTQLGVQGATGYAQGDHVHLEIRRNGAMQFIPGQLRTTFARGEAIPQTFAELSDPQAGPQIRFTMTLDAIPQQQDDFRADQGSQGIRDVYVGQYMLYRVNVENTGPVAAQNVGLGLWHDSKYLGGIWYGAFTKNAQGSWETSPIDGQEGKWWFAETEVLHVGNLEAGQTKQILIWCFARRVSLPDEPNHPDVRLWLKHVDNFYEKDDFFAAPNNVKNLQKYNGGDVKSYFEVDVWQAARKAGTTSRYR